ncbi:hypothetical protein CTI12_AA271150 [Artemisia annua]|uniref:Uncharacterized protein n=1 Tax=Artemisia annua TaxID=35608 RepID=A0A2U1NFU9_ARTAN|nr:hypothetical protein CTI12_AA271150 [Artemisia annua]
MENEEDLVKEQQITDINKPIKLVDAISKLTAETAGCGFRQLHCNDGEHLIGVSTKIVGPRRIIGVSEAQDAPHARASVTGPVQADYERKRTLKASTYLLILGYEVTNPIHIRKIYFLSKTRRYVSVDEG